MSHGNFGPLTARSRMLAGEFARLLELRARREAEINTASSAAETTARGAFERAIAAAEQARAERTRLAEQSRDEAVASRVGGLQAKLDAAASARAAALEELQNRAASDESAIKKWLAEKVWMADSVFETASPKPGVMFEATRKELTAAGERLRVIEAEATAYLRGCRMWPASGGLGDGASGAAGPAPEDVARWGEGEAARRLTEMSAAAQQRASQLQRMFVPRMFGALWPGVLVVLAAGAGVGGWGAWRGWTDAGQLGIGAGIGAAAGVVLLLGLRWLAKRRVTDVRLGLAHALAEARAAGERRLEIAAENRRREETKIKDAHELDTKGAQAKAAARRDELAKARREKTATIEERWSTESRDLTAARDAAQAEIDREHATRLAEIDAQHRRAVSAAENERDRALAAGRAARDRDSAELRGTFASGMRQAYAQARESHDLVHSTCPEWTLPRWEREDRAGSAGEPGWAPAESPPPAVAVGRVRLDLAALPGGAEMFGNTGSASEAGGPSTLDLPIAMELPDRCSLLLRTGAHGRAESLALLQATMLRLLTTFPPGKARFTILDPVGLGQNFAAFMHLLDYEAALVGDRIWTEPRHIEQRLTDLTEHMENVIQKYLRNQFRTIEEYNTHAGEVAEPYRFLVIADLPAGFNEMAAKRLASILDSGPRCGVYTLIACDARQALPQGLTKGDLAKVAVQLTWKASKAGDEARRISGLALPAAARVPAEPSGDSLRGLRSSPAYERGELSGDSAAKPASSPAWGAFVVDDPELGTLPLTVEAPPADALFNRLVHMVGRHAKDSSRVRVPFEMIAPPLGEGEAGLWKLSSAAEVAFPIGRAGATKLQHMTLGKGTAQHALIAGRTGSGKSTLLHAMITSLATWYGPDEIEMYLVDFKKGVEFKTYASHEIPHARVIAIESEREFGLSVLRRLDSELKRRGELFREAEVQDIAGFRVKQPRARMPRVLLIVDEFQELFVEDDKLAQEASLLLDRLVRQGRAFGMHAVLGSQTLGGAYSLARSTIGQMAVRIALQCSEADSYLILSDDNPAARLLSRPGEAIYNDASGALEGNSPFQVAFLPEDKRDMFLDLVQARQAREAGAGPACAGLPGAARLEPPIIFEGSAPAHVERNPILADLLAGRARPGLSRGALHAWVGEPIAIKEPTAAVFRRQSAANLLIVGQRDEAALAMFATALVSLHAQRAPSGSEGGSGNGSRNAEGAERDAEGAERDTRSESRSARSASVPTFLVLDGTPADAPTAGYLERAAAAIGPAARLVGYREIDAALAELAAEIDRRSASDSADAPSRFVCVYGLQRFRALRRPENEFDFGSASADGAAPSPDKLFSRILREGPAVGVHTLVWVDTVSSLNRTLERAALREFDQRILFQMSASDSSALIDVASAGLIGANRALFYSEEQGTIEKFRPYALPGEGWVGRISESSI